MKAFFQRSSNTGYIIICLSIPLIAFGLCYNETYDLVFSFVASLLVAAMPPLVRFIYVLNSDKKN